MKGNWSGERRKTSFGTKFMLVMLALVLGGSALVIWKLSSGGTVDLSRLTMNPLNLQQQPGQEGKQPPEEGTDRPADSTTKPAPAVTAAPEKTETESAREQPGQFTVTIGGTLYLSGEMEQHCKNPDTKTYDYADMMRLLAPRVRSDVNIVFLENILGDEYKINNTAAPETAADILKEAGFTMAACGYAEAFSKGADGVETTRMVLTERGIRPAGIRDSDEQGVPEPQTAGGIRYTILQYTGTLSSKTRKSMAKAGQSAMVPEAEASLIAAEIAEARSKGAEAVIVLVNWGQNGKKVSRQQQELAAAIAQAGADVIIGNGSRIPQGAEYLEGPDGRAVLCVWSLGSLMSGDRSNTKHMAGYLLHLTVRSNGKGGADILNPEYTPVYTWKYKQDSRYYYRCLASDGPVPDGMDSEQRANLEKTAEMVDETLANSPVSHRETE